MLSVLECKEAYELADRPKNYVPADDQTLQLDIDSVADLVEFKQRLSTIDTLWNQYLEPIFERGSNKSLVFTEIPSKTKGHTHITIPLKYALPVEDRLLLQTLLCSDPTREFLSYLRAKLGIADPILLAVK